MNNESTVFHTTKKSNKNSQVSCLATQILSEATSRSFEKPSAPSFKSTFVLKFRGQVGMNSAGDCGSKFLDHQTISTICDLNDPNWSQIFIPGIFFVATSQRRLGGLVDESSDTTISHISIINPGWRLSMVGLRILRDISISLAFCISFL